MFTKITPEQAHLMNEYQLAGIHCELQYSLEKSPTEIIDSLSNGSEGRHKVSLWHMLTGLQGEVGELTDALKKSIIYNKELDRENVVEELGDIEFYLQGIRTRLGIVRERTLAHNILKLQDRYKAGTYSDQAAQERADKV